MKKPPSNKPGNDLEECFKAAMDSLKRPKGRRPDWPMHVLIAAEREKAKNPRLRDRTFVERFCPCRLDRPDQRPAHTRECLEALRRSRRTYRAMLRRLKKS